MCLQAAISITGIVILQLLGGVAGILIGCGLVQLGYNRGWFY